MIYFPCYKKKTQKYLLHTDTTNNLNDVQNSQLLYEQFTNLWNFGAHTLETFGIFRKFFGKLGMMTLSSFICQIALMPNFNRWHIWRPKQVFIVGVMAYFIFKNNFNFVTPHTLTSFNNDYCRFHFWHRFYRLWLMWHLQNGFQFDSIYVYKVSQKFKLCWENTFNMFSLNSIR